MAASKTRSAAAFFCALVLFGPPAFAQLPEADLRLGSRVVLLADEQNLLCVGGGVFDLIREGYSAGKTTGYSGVGSVEYRLGRKLLFAGPLVGMLANSDGGVFGYGGFFFFFPPPPPPLPPPLCAGGGPRGGTKGTRRAPPIPTRAQFPPS